jgi:hypothetical protein
MTARHERRRMHERVVDVPRPQHELETLGSETRRPSLDNSEPMIGQTWRLDGEADVLITDLVIEPNGYVIQRVEIRERDGLVKSLPLREFSSRAVYRDG